MKISKSNSKNIASQHTSPCSDVFCCAENLQERQYGEWITSKHFAGLSPIADLDKIQSKAKVRRDKRHENKHILFRKQFSLSDLEARTIIKISADDHYKLFLNGTFVSEGVAPCYPSAQNYHQIDITDLLQVGLNTLAVHTYYQGLVNRVWVSGDRQHGLFFEIWTNDQLVCKSDESVLCHKHTGFKKAHIIAYKTAFAENYDATAEEHNFADPNFDDSKWKRAPTRQWQSYKLRQQTTELLEYETIVAEKTETRCDNKSKVTRFDFGAEYVGTLCFCAESKSRQGDKIIVRYAEELDDKGNLRFKTRCYCHYEDTYAIAGCKVRLTQYDYKAFRYAEIISKNETEIGEVYLQAQHHPFALVGECPFEKEKAKEIWHFAVDSLKYGIQDVFMDCPTREKGQYLGDGFMTAIAHLKLTGKTDMTEQLLDVFADSAKIRDGLTAVAPCSFIQEIADFSLLYPVLLKEYMSFSGDRNTKRFLSASKSVVDFFERYANENGLIDSMSDKWNLVDWPKSARDNYSTNLIQFAPVHGVHNVINAYYIGAQKAIRDIELMLDESADTRDIDQKIAKLENAYHNEFLTSDRLFADTKERENMSVHSNAIALWFDLVHDTETEQNIIDMIIDKKLDNCNLFGTMMIFMALKRVGRIDIIEDLVVMDDYWVNMIKEGATRTFEAFSKDKKNNTALFHLALAAVVAMI